MGQIFTSSTAIFDESDFPKCKTSSVELSLIKHAIDIPLPSSLQHDTDHLIHNWDADPSANPEDNYDNDHSAAPNPVHGDLDDQSPVDDNVPTPAPVPHQQIELWQSTRSSHIPNHLGSTFGT
ncbi:hypothetical protein Moror_15808 [Moniliophthora roreri MCA 2997]|uniref:Uncharacterized protein n=1 Tax=Moniliophthora roreri (strain MCA 2997) TaxID=1381753 RepID=V2XPP8_MONRO|nr:hypothetical protein Moror_15808 [Moniliophthora roreri MCA 2997]